MGPCPVALFHGLLHGIHDLLFGGSQENLGARTHSSAVKQRGFLRRNFWMISGPFLSRPLGLLLNSGAGDGLSRDLSIGESALGQIHVADSSAHAILVKPSNKPIILAFIVSFQMAR